MAGAASVPPATTEPVPKPPPRPSSAQNEPKAAASATADEDGQAPGFAMPFFNLFWVDDNMDESPAADGPLSNHSQVTTTPVATGGEKNLLTPTSTGSSQRVKILAPIHEGGDGARPQGRRLKRRLVRNVRAMAALAARPLRVLFPASSSSSATSGAPANAPAPAPDALLTLGDILRAAEKSDRSLMIIPWTRLALDKVVATGAFGKVSRGNYNGTAIAVKELKPGGFISELLEEVETMRNLLHPNLLSTIGLASDYDAQLGVVMEFLPATLFSVLHDKQYTNNPSFSPYLNFRQCFLSLMTDVAVGMGYLHYVGMVHRDLKPQNILLTESWTAKIADFGEVLRKAGAKRRAQRVGRVQKKDSPDNSFTSNKSAGSHHDHQSLNSSLMGQTWMHQMGSLRSVTVGVDGKINGGTLRGGMGGTLASNTGGGEDDRVRGTPPYMSPEAASAGTDQVVETGPPADVWGFGCVLAHVAHKRPPYVGVYQSAREIIYALRDGTAQPLAQLKSKHVPPVLSAICEQCCQYDPSKRPTFSQISTMLQEQQTILQVCGDASVVDEDDGYGNVTVEAARPMVVLKRLDKIATAPAPANVVLKQVLLDC